MVTVLLCLSPVLALIIVIGGVVIVALCKANAEDVPKVMGEATQIFRRLTDRLLHRRWRASSDRRDTDPDDEEAQR
jgi:hypothetical protein